jgi:fatty-acyl-CoA synthase
LIDSLIKRRAELESKYPVWRPATLSEFFYRIAESFPDNDFIVTTDDSWSYSRAAVIIEQIVKALVKFGVEKGDHVAVALNNCPEYFFLTFALSQLGAVKVSINTKLAPSGIRQILEQSDSKYLFIENDNLLLPKLKNKFNAFSLKSYCVVGAPFFPANGGISWEKFIEAGNSFKIENNNISPHDITDIFYTSGSTSEPKGVMLTHDMLLRSAYASTLNRGFESGRRIYVPLPFYHVYGYVEGLLAALFVGGAILCGQNKFEARKSLAFLSRTRANDILGVPSIMMGLVKEQEMMPVDLSALHAVYCSASTCPEWLWARIRNVLNVSDVITGYGMTEVCGASVQTDCCDGDQILSVKVGKVLCGGASGNPGWDGRQIQYRVVDVQTGLDVPNGAYGELWCRGSVVTVGYYNNERANKESFTEDGWFKTGDIGSFDESGYLELHGRADDIYKVNGENISPRYIEAEIIKCPHVKYVEVLGVAYPKYGEVGVAFVELWADTPQARRELIEYTSGNLGGFQRPYRFYFMNEDMWPIGSTGKINKHSLKQMAHKNLMSEKPQA